MGTDQDDRIPVVIGRDDHVSLNWNMFLTGHTNHYDHGDSVESERYQETAAAERAQTEANPADPRIQEGKTANQFQEKIRGCQVPRPLPTLPRASNRRANPLPAVR